MHCDIYKFPKYEDLYVYVARPNYPDDIETLTDWLGVLPKAFRTNLGCSEFVMHLDLGKTDKINWLGQIKLTYWISWHHKAIMCRCHQQTY